MYGATPPEAVIEAVPLAIPLHVTLVEAVEKVSKLGSLTVIDVVFEHPLRSLI